MSERKDFERACDAYCDAVKRGYDYYEPRKAMRALFSRAIETRDAEIATLRKQLREANCCALDAEMEAEELAVAHRTELARAKNALNEQMEKWDNVVTRSHGVLNFDSREGLTEWWWFFATGLLDVPANLVSREG